MKFAPRAVPSSSWRHWLVAGIALTTQRLVAFLGLSAAAIAFHAVPDSAGVGVLVVPIVLGVGCVIASSADNGRPVFSLLRETPPVVFRRLMIIGALFVLLAWIFGAFVVLLADPLGVDAMALQLPSSDTARSVVEAMCGSWMLSASVCLFGASVLLGFLVPLVALGGLPLREAAILAVSAVRLNPFVVVATSALAATAVVGLLTPFLAVPWTAFVSAVLYVAYRDVFLGRRDNVPVIRHARSSASALAS